MDNFEEAKSYGSKISRDAILTLMESQVAAWESERQTALSKARQEPGYNSWQSRAEQLAYYINATEFWVDKLTVKSTVYAPTGKRAE